MSQLSDLRIYDPVLSKIALGYSNEDFIADKIYPVVFVEKEKGKIPQFGKESFQVHDSKRDIRTESKRIDWGITSIVYELEEYSLESAIDDREIQEGNPELFRDQLSLEAVSTKNISDSLLLQREKSIADEVQNSLSYPTDNKITLDGTTGKKYWSDEANADPIKNINDAKEVIRSKIGRNPNTLILGSSTFNALRNSEQLKDMFKYTPNVIITSVLLSQIFDIPNVYVGKSVYYNGTSFTDTWEDNAILAFVGGESPYNPSIGYTLMKSGYPRVTKYRDERIKSNIVNVSHIWGKKLTCSDAGYIIMNTVG